MNTKQIREAAKNAILAGLGVVSIAQKEASKVYDQATKKTNQFYDTLVKEGKSLEKKSKKSVDKLADQAEGKFKNLKNMATKQFSKIEDVFETKVESALTKLDIPTVDDLKGLSKRVDTLIKEIKKVEKKAA